MDRSYVVSLVLHFLSQFFSWIICAHLINSHPAIHHCINAQGFLALLAVIFTDAILIGAVPFASTPRDNDDAISNRCSCIGCICSTEFCDSNALLTRRRIVLLSIFQAVFLPIWIVLVENEKYWASFIIMLVLLTLVFFTYINVFAVRSSRCTTILIFLLIATGFCSYVALLGLTLCSWKHFGL